MSEHKQIERVFQEAFSGFEAKPSKQVWENLQGELQQKKTKRSILFWLISASAIFLVGFLSFMFLNTKNTSKQTKNILNNNLEKPFSYDTQKIAFNIIPNNLYFEDNTITNTNYQNSFLFKLNENLFNTIFIKDFYLNKNNITIDPNQDENQTIIDLSTDSSNVTKNNTSKKSTNKIVSSIKKWEFTPYSSVTYFSSIGQGSPLDESLKDNKKEFETSQSFGFNIGKQIAKRWKLSAGLSLLKLNYSTFNIAYKNENSLTNRLSGVNYNQYNHYTSVRDLENNIIAWNEHKGKIQQEIEYLEVPISVSYTIKNSKHLDLGLTGGISTLFLTNNQLSLHDTNSGEERYFGKANNLSMINASANASLDFNYHISKNIHFNVSPSFKYYMEMFEENSGNFKPYSIGVSTGLKVKF
jgi:hypothetical protein